MGYLTTNLFNMRNSNMFLWCLVITLGVIILINKEADQKYIEQRQTYLDSISVPLPLKEARGYDYSKGIYLYYPTDLEIRKLRQDNPDLIIKAPGRVILSEDQEFKKRVEQYIEDHHDEIIEQYRD